MTSPMWTPTDSYMPTVHVEHLETRDEQAALERRIVERAETDRLIKTMLGGSRPAGPNRAARRHR